MGRFFRRPNTFATSYLNFKLVEAIAKNIDFPISFLHLILKAAAEKGERVDADRASSSRRLPTARTPKRAGWQHSNPLVVLRVQQQQQKKRRIINILH